MEHWTIEEDAILYALYGQGGTDIAGISHMLRHRTESAVSNRIRELRRNGAFSRRMRFSAADITYPQEVRSDMAKRIGQSKEQADILRVIQGQGWTFEYTGSGHIRCVGPKGEVVIMSSRPGFDAKRDFRRHGVWFPGDDQVRPRSADKPLPPVEPPPADTTTDQEGEPETPIVTSSADLTIELVAKAVDSLSDMIEVLGVEIASLRTKLDEQEATTSSLLDQVRVVDERVSQIRAIDPVSALKAALRGT